MYCAIMKHYLCAGFIADCHIFQNHLDSFVNWFKNNCLSLNISKYKIFTYSRCRSSIIHSYNILDFDILRTEKSVIDLGFKLTTLLDPRPHIDMVRCTILKNSWIYQQTGQGFQNRFVI